MKKVIRSADGLTTEQRVEIAKNSRDPKELKRLAEDEDWEVRHAVAQYTNDPEILAQLANDDDWSVRVVVAQRTDDPKLLAQLANDESSLVKWHVAERTAERTDAIKDASIWPSPDEFSEMDEDEILEYVGWPERDAASELNVDILSDDSSRVMRISDEVADNPEIQVDCDSWIDTEYEIAMSVKSETSFKEHFKTYLLNLIDEANWSR